MRFFSIVIALLFTMHVSAHQAPKIKEQGQLAVSVALDAHDKLWRVAVNNGYVEVSSSNDLAKHFSKAVRVNTEKQKITARGEVRPKIAFGINGEIYITWIQELSKHFSSYIWFARSINGGKSFEEPIIVHQDRAEIGHEFEEISISPNGVITVLWLDERDLLADKRAGKKRSGSSIYYTTSNDNGSTFLPEKKLADYSCECCRIAMTSNPDGTAVAFWRHIFEGNERDHMIAEIPKAGVAPTLTRATYGHWQIDGCPHHGGAIANGGEGDDWWGYHLAYFDGKDKKPGLYYTRIDGKAWATVPAKQFGDNAKQARHPALMSKGKQVWLAWLETAPNNTKKVMLKHSADEGKSWSEDKVLLEEKGKIDFPQLLKGKDIAFIAVNTASGLKVMPLQ